MAYLVQVGNMYVETVNESGVSLTKETKFALKFCKSKMEISNDMAPTGLDYELIEVEIPVRLTEKEIAFLATILGNVGRAEISCSLFKKFYSLTSFAQAENHFHISTDSDIEFIKDRIDKHFDE
jgi:hypothetical protein